MDRDEDSAPPWAEIAALAKRAGLKLTDKGLDDLDAVAGQVLERARKSGEGLAREAEPAFTFRMRDAERQ